MRKTILIGLVSLFIAACSPPADAGGRHCRIGHWRPLAKICHRIKMRRHCRIKKRHHSYHHCAPKPCKPCDMPDAPAPPA